MPPEVDLLPEEGLLLPVSGTPEVGSMPLVLQQQEDLTPPVLQPPVLHSEAEAAQQLVVAAISGRCVGFVVRLLAAA